MTDTGRFLDRLVYEDEFFLVSHAIVADGTAYRGDPMVQTKRHARDLATLTDAESGRLGWLLGRLSRPLKECTPADWTYPFCFLDGFRYVHLGVVAR